MSEQHRESTLPAPVSTHDVEALSTLEQTYEGILNNNVRTIRDESIPDIIDKTRELSGKILSKLGGVANDEAVVIGLIDLSDDEKSLLNASRRVKPTLYH